MKGAFFFVLLFVSYSSFAQPADIISLRKNDRVVKTYFRGDHISFVTTGGASRQDALITDIRHDSIYLQEFQVQQVMMAYGGYLLDTLTSYRYAYNYRDIKSFGKPSKGFNLLASGSTLIGGGILLTVGSLVVLAADKEKFSPELMGAGAGAAILGYFMTKGASKPIVVGKKKYTITYMNMQNEKPATVPPKN